MIYTLVIFPLSRASDWEWIAGSASPELSTDGTAPATHRWFSIIPTTDEQSRIDSTLSADDRKLTVDTNTESPTAVIQAATGLQPVIEED